MKPARGGSFFLFFFLASALVVAGCSGINFGDKQGAGSGATSASSSAATSPPDAGAKGIDCVTEQTTGATICTGVSSCPQLVVDHDVYPDCGFRVKGTTLDLECACNGSLCPIGVAMTCEQAKQLLSAQTEQTVCIQVGEGRCTAGTPTTGTGGGPTSTCDKACSGQCGGDPGCIKGCGC